MMGKSCGHVTHLFALGSFEAGFLVKPIWHRQSSQWKHATQWLPGEVLWLHFHLVLSHKSDEKTGPLLRISTDLGNHYDKNVHFFPHKSSQLWLKLNDGFNKTSLALLRQKEMYFCFNSLSPSVQFLGKILFSFSNPSFSNMSFNT